SVAQIFATDGEAHFRALERHSVEEACAVPDAIIATGGGTLVDAENHRRLAAAGPVVCLTASPEEIARRVGDVSSRPLLVGHNGDRLPRRRTLLAERRPARRASLPSRSRSPTARSPRTSAGSRCSTRGCSPSGPSAARR